MRHLPERKDGKSTKPRGSVRLARPQPISGGIAPEMAPTAVLSQVTRFNGV
jgi:hypothetical protein